MTLTLFQTTNFRLCETERVCRRHFQFWSNCRNVFQMGRKHCWKRRNCLLWAISAFLTVFLKDLYGRHGLFVKGLTLYQTAKLTTSPDWDRQLNQHGSKTELCFGKSRKYCGKRRKWWLPGFSAFPAMFSKSFFLRVVKSGFYGK